MTATVSTASVTVGNDLPSASNPVLVGNTGGGTTITLTEGATTSVSVTGTVTDNNGCYDLASVNIAVYKDGSPCAVSGDANNDTCYFANVASSSASITGCSGGVDTSSLVSHEFILQYYTDPGTWKTTITPMDISAEATGTADTSSGVTLNESQAIAVSSISYGSVSAGATSTGDHIATTTNTGNITTDVKVSGTALTCNGFGSIPVGNEQYATSSFSHGAGIVLTGVASTLGLGLDLQAPAAGTAPVTDLTYWQVEVLYGVKGTCSGDITFATF